MIDINLLWQMPLVYFGLYLFFVFAKTIFSGTFIDKIIFCNICATWFIFMIYGFFVYPLVISAFQIGLSMTGISMFFNEKLGQKKKRFPFDFFLLQLIVTIIGIGLIILKSIYFNTQ